MPQFIRYGRAWHLEIEDHTALRAVLDLDDALWIATSAPISTLHGDEGFLRRLDPDGDGRIGLRDVKDAIRWVFDQLADPAALRRERGALPLSAIKSPSVRAAAQQVLARAGASATSAVTVAQVRQVSAEERAKGLATADRVLPTATDDAALRAWIEHAIAVTGGEAHPSGGAAISAATSARFRADLAAWTSWVGAGRLETPESVTEVNPLGDRTPRAAAAVRAVAPAMEAWFTLCDAAQVDPGVGDRAWPRIQLGDGEALLDPASVAAVLRRAPVAKPDPSGRLSLGSTLNPSWSAEVRELFEAAAAPLGFDAGVDRKAFAQIQARLAPHDAWVAARPNDAACGRDEATVAAHLASTELPARVEELLEKSQESAAIVAGFDTVEKLGLFCDELLVFTSSFTSCTDLFRDGRQPCFNMGELIADGRRFKLAIRVPDKGRSLTFAPMASAFLVYANVGSAAGVWDYEVVVPVTAGERGLLVEGAFCVFIDRTGQERLAQINKVVSNPISIWEAMFAPFVAVQRAVEGWLERRQAAAEADLTAKASEAAIGAAERGVDHAASVGTVALAAGQAAANAPKDAAPAPAPAPAPKAEASAMSSSNMTAMFTGGSIAIAALGSAFALLGGFFSSLSPLGLVGVALGVGGAFIVPTALLAWVKLRRRDVSALLEGSGWGMNHRMRIERHVALQFTVRPDLPAGASTRGKDTGDGPLPALLMGLAVVFCLFAVGWKAWEARETIGAVLHLDLGSAGAAPPPPPAAPAG